MLKCLLEIIKPTFQHIISNRCYHMRGPQGVKLAIRHIHHALQYNTFQYVIRADIKGYYASISRKNLLKQLNHHYQDPRLQNYFEQIVNVAIDKRGNVFLPNSGIPRRSSLSPFFGALYLAELDHALSKREGIEYFRYMDDIIILATTKRQFQRAKKCLYGVLNKLELKLSSAKTKMSRLSSSFHFLGVLFEVPRSPQTQNQVRTVLHPRSCARALDRFKAMQNDAVHPATQQRYLIRWASWWSDTVPSIGVMSLVLCWVKFAAARDPTAAWLGRGLLPRLWLT